MKLKIINTEYCDIPSLYHFLFVYELNDQYIILGATQFCVLFDLKNWKCLNGIQNVLNENNFAKIDNSSFATFSKNPVTIYSIPDLKEVNTFAIDNVTRYGNASIIFHKKFQYLIVSTSNDIITAYNLRGMKIWTLKQEFSLLYELTNNAMMVIPLNYLAVIDLHNFSRKITYGRTCRSKNKYKFQFINNMYIGFNKGYESCFRLEIEK